MDIINSTIERMQISSGEIEELFKELIPSSVLDGLNALILLSKILLFIFIFYLLIKLLLKLKEFRNKMNESKLYENVQDINRKLSEIISLLESNKNQNTKEDSLKENKKESKKHKK